jgi:hypothetical protein
VDEAIEDRIGERRVLELGVPELERQLAGDDDTATLLAILEEFEQQRLMARGRDPGGRDPRQPQFVGPGLWLSRFEPVGPELWLSRFPDFATK